ncbi:MAG: alpha-glucosidase/alpha-galactosidase, partial [Truepera sp.]|nr:alpha-glucosidase/alpha-galactosidase [Truepera sp.]
MPKITLIGAGSVVFTRNLCSDILLTPALQESTIALMDVDEKRLKQALDL